jgi:hypothetical protein
MVNLDAWERILGQTADAGALSRLPARRPRRPTPWGYLPNVMAEGRAAQLEVQGRSLNTWWWLRRRLWRG